MKMRTINNCVDAIVYTRDYITEHGFDGLLANPYSHLSAHDHEWIEKVTESCCKPDSDGTWGEGDEEYVINRLNEELAKFGYEPAFMHASTEELASHATDLFCSWRETAEEQLEMLLDEVYDNAEADANIADWLLLTQRSNHGNAVTTIKNMAVDLFKDHFGI